MPTAQEIAQEVSTLLSFPEAAVHINKLVDDPESSNEALSKAILKDPGLTARVLKLVNSPMFRRKTKIETVSHAVTLLGRQEIRNLVLATSVAQAFKSLPPEVVDMAAFWRNSICCGTAASFLARALNVPHEERLFIAGLLHGVGKLVFYSQYPDHYRLVLEHRENGEDAIIAAEREVFGFDHAVMASALLCEWKFPDTLQLIIAHYLEPEKAQEFQVETAIVSAAASIAQHIDPIISSGRATGDDEPKIKPYVWESLKLEQIQLQQVVESAKQQTLDVF
jgi:HD-like signal output (HDOD) protein